MNLNDNHNLDNITCPIHSFETFGAVDGPELDL